MWDTKVVKVLKLLLKSSSTCFSNYTVNSIVELESYLKTCVSIEKLWEVISRIFYYKLTLTTIDVAVAG